MTDPKPPSIEEMLNSDSQVEKLFNEWNKRFIGRQKELDDVAKKVLKDNLWELME
tara:strand:- start:19532 stop:19696 length:165 start_codon:yes stop_codon:yes gene_type:complete